MTPSTPPESSSASSLWLQFKVANLDRVTLLGEAATALAENGLDEDLRREAERAAHQLVGSLGSLGFPGGTLLAREIEQLIRGTDTLTPDLASSLHERVRLLARELEGNPSEWEAVPVEPVPSLQAPLMLIVEDDVELCARLIAEAGARGIRTRVAADPAAAWAALNTDPPDVLLLDLSFPAAADDGLALLARVAEHGLTVPVLVLTGRDRFADRIDVARNGGRGFIQKPMPPWRVLDAVIHLLHQPRAARARVLAVDDDRQILATLRALLEPGGLGVTTEDNPLSFWQTLHETSPDILILDVDMPDVSGIELCRVVRNDPRWASLPVLFLTGRIDADSVHQMFAAGADDYVGKPIIGPELLTRVTNRLERTRLLREMAETDYLTALPNRRRSGQEIERMLRLAHRHHQPFSLAILDLDRFKAVNDEHGHTSGDQVLRSIGALLLSTFRTEDVIGRWGGEEFVLGMYGMSRKDGVDRVTALLETFRRDKIAGPESSFSVTFSAGVAQYPEDGSDLPSLYRSADVALYQAKATGRNRVLPVGWAPEPTAVAGVPGAEDRVRD